MQLKELISESQILAGSKISMSCRFKRKKPPCFGKYKNIWSVKSIKPKFKHTYLVICSFNPSLLNENTSFAVDVHHVLYETNIWYNYCNDNIFLLSV